MTTVASHSAPERVAFFNFDKPPSNRPPGSSRPESPINILAVTPRTAFDTYQTAFFILRPPQRPNPAFPAGMQPQRPGIPPAARPASSNPAAQIIGGSAFEIN